jgi:predicted phosphoribosyltransferase
MYFRDRVEAGQKLATRLDFLKDEPHVVVLAIPRGGVVVGAEVARALDAPLDVCITRKIGAPFNPELALGAVASDGTLYLDDLLIAELGVPRQEIEAETAEQIREIARRAKTYRKGRPALNVADQIAVLTDDGVATGSTTLVALRALNKQNPARLILAIPVAPPQVIPTLARECDQVVVLDTPEPFWAVGRFYREFDQTTDAEVVELLEEAAKRG